MLRPLSLTLTLALALAFTPRNSHHCIQWVGSDGHPELERFGVDENLPTGGKLCRGSAGGDQIGMTTSDGKCAGLYPVVGDVKDYQVGVLDPSCQVWWRWVSMDVIPPVPELTYMTQEAITDLHAYCRIQTDAGYTLGIFHAAGPKFGSCFYLGQDGQLSQQVGGGFSLIHAREADKACVPNQEDQISLAASLKAKVDRFLSQHDRDMVAAASKVSFEELYEQLLQQDSCVLTQVLSGMRLVLHPLNKLGLQPMRSILAEKMQIARRSEMGLDRHPEFEQFSQNGFVLRPLEGVDRATLVSLLQMASGQPIVNLPEGELNWAERNTTHEANDPQYELHQDTFSGAFKVWAFPGDTVLEHGPLHYIKGSHRNTPGRLAWMMKASNTQDAVTEPSLRFRPRDSAPEGFAPAVPVLPLSPDGWTLVVADTSGLHARGTAVPGSLRRSLRLFGDNDGGIPRLNPFRDTSPIGQLQLKGGNTDSGKLWFKHTDAQWYPVVTPSWTKAEASATCRQLGFHAAFQVMSYPSESPAPPLRFDFDCDGSEPTLARCRSKVHQGGKVCAAPLLEVGVSCIAGLASTTSEIDPSSMAAELARRTTAGLEKFRTQTQLEEAQPEAVKNLGKMECTLPESVENMLDLVNESAYVHADKVADYFAQWKIDARDVMCHDRTKAGLIAGLLRSGMTVTALGVDLSACPLPPVSEYHDLKQLNGKSGLMPGHEIATKLYRPLLDADWESVRSVLLNPNAHHPVHWHLDQPLRNVRTSWLELSSTEATMYNTLQKDGFLFIEDYGFSDSQLDELMATADRVVQSTDARMTSAVSDGAVVTSRLSVPMLEELVTQNSTIQKVVRSYLGNETTLNGYKLTRLHGLNSTDQYIASQWHHDRTGRRLKMFVYLHDVDCIEGHPTKVVLGTQNIQYFKTESFPFSRYTDQYVSDNFKVAKGCGKKGSGFLFDTHTLHKATVLGKHDRTTAIFEFHNAVKCSLVEKANMGIPCPSGDQYLVNHLL